MNHANPSNADDNRSSEMEDVHAGWSQALKLLLRKLLMHESGPAHGGIPFTVGGEVCTVYAKVSDIISDGDGHRQGLESVGAGGMSGAASSMQTSSGSDRAWLTTGTFS